MSAASSSELQRDFEEVLATEMPHVKRLTPVTVILTEALRRRELEATLVGGGAIEFHVPMTYTTTDITLAVESKRGAPVRPVLNEVFGSFSLVRRDRHWTEHQGLGSLDA